MRGLLVVAVACLAAGLFVIFYFGHGESAVSLAYPLSGASVHIDITTTGVGVPGAVGLTFTGAFLLIVATVIALIGMFRRERDIPPSRHRDSAFEE